MNYDHDNMMRKNILDCLKHNHYLEEFCVCAMNYLGTNDKYSKVEPFLIINTHINQLNNWQKVFHENNDWTKSNLMHNFKSIITHFILCCKNIKISVPKYIKFMILDYVFCNY